MATAERPGDDEARIAKVIARAGLCSRRDAETWIAAGRVALNGRILTSPAVNVTTSDTILVDGTPLAARERTRLFLFHKPRGYVTTDRDPEERPTIFSVFPDGLPRLVTIGRLDINTEGLLLLTNDGGLARVLELPATGWLRRYRVRARGETNQAALDALREGVTVEGVHYAGIEATLDRPQGANVWLTMGLREGKNREVKRVLETLGLEVNRLIRVSFGPFQLGNLAEGAVEEVKTRVIKDQIGHDLAREAGVDFEGAVTASIVTQEVRQRQRDERQSRVPAGASGSGRPVRGKRDDVRPSERASDRGSERGGDERRKPRDSAPVAAPSPRPGRPVSGARKHVSVMRAEPPVQASGGERTRVARDKTADRHGRPVAVERVMRTAPRASGDALVSRNGRRFANERAETAAPAGEGRTRSFEKKTASKFEPAEGRHGKPRTEKPEGKMPRRGSGQADRTGATKNAGGNRTLRRRSDVPFDAPHGGGPAGKPGPRGKR